MPRSGRNRDWTAMGVALLLAVAACQVLLDPDPPSVAANDASTSPAIDASTETAPVPDAATNDGASFCGAEAADALFCDDFTAPEVAWLVWRESNLGPTTFPADRLERDQELFASPPASAIASHAALDNAEQSYSSLCFRRVDLSPDIGDSFDFSMDLNVERATLAPSGVLFLSINMATGPPYRDLNVGINQNGLFLQQLINNGEEIVTALAPFPEKAWQTLGLEVRRRDSAGGGEHVLTVKIGAAIAVKDIVLAPELFSSGATPTAIYAGIVYAEPQGAIRVNFDNVAFWKR